MWKTYPGRFEAEKANELGRAINLSLVEALLIETDDCESDTGADSKIHGISCLVPHAIDSKTGTSHLVGTAVKVVTTIRIRRKITAIKFFSLRVFCQR